MERLPETAAAGDWLTALQTAEAAPDDRLRVLLAVRALHRLPTSLSKQALDRYRSKIQLWLKQADDENLMRLVASWPSLRSQGT